MLIDLLMNQEFLNFSFFLLDFVRNNIASCCFQPSFTPRLEFILYSQSLSSLAEMSNEVLQLRVFKCVLLEVILQSLLENLLPK
jgi:hypothetical protein